MARQAIIVKTRTQPGRRSDVQAAYEEHLAQRANANPAQEVVVWMEDQSDPDVFYQFEIYNSMEAMEANSQAPWFFEYLGAVGPMLAGEPEVSLGSPSWAKGIPA